MMYLINCEVVFNYYQSETKRTEMNHIVEADNEDEAMSKVTRHYELQDSEYNVKHYVGLNYCNELIK